MDDFVFRGRDIAQFGATAAFGSTTKMGAKIARSEYDLPGGGSIIIGGETYQPTSREVTILPLEGVIGDAAWARAILSWLCAGRGELIVLGDPDVVRLAQFDGEATYGPGIWPLGGLRLTMTLQPLAYAATPTTASGLTDGGAISLSVAAGCAMQMPVLLKVTGRSGTITAMTVTGGGHRLALTGFALKPDDVIRYDAGQRLGDVMELTIGGEPGWSAVTHWDRVAIADGEPLAVSVTGGEASVALSVRARFPA